jgi:hypothetical protein
MTPQPQFSDAQKPCPNCQSTNPSGLRFCGHCGNTLNPIPETINSMVAEQVKRELDRLKDQKVVAVEIAESVYERVSKWAKIFIVLLIIPLGAAIYFIYGQYTNLSEVIKTSRSETERILAGSTARARTVEGMVEAANKKTQELNALIDQRTKSLVALDSKVGGYETQMQEYEARVSTSGTQALSQVNSLKQNSDKALNEIGQLRDAVNRQQKALTETGALLKDLANRSFLEGFKSGQPSSNFLSVTRTPTSHALCMRLTKVPYRETVRVQYFLALQPPDAYIVLGNVVILPYWEDSIDKLAERQIFVSYIADANPPALTPFFRAISVKNGAIYGDDTLLLPALPPRVH